MSLYRPPITVLGATHYEHQPRAYLNVTPTQNSWYTVLDTTENVLLIWVRVKQTNDGAAAKSLAVRITVDGRTAQSGLVSCANNTNYFCYITEQEAVVVTTDVYNAGRYVAWHAKSAKVEVQFGDVPGTNQSLIAYVGYAKLRATTI